MDRKKERGLWIGVTSVLALVLVAIVLAPRALAQSDNSRTSQEYLRDIEKAFMIVSSNYVDEVDPKVLFEGVMNGLMGSLDDPYSNYLTDETLTDYTDVITGSFVGVGLYISKEWIDPENPHGRQPYVRVMAPIEGTPGWKAGINAGDYIYAIDGVSAENYSTADVSNKLRGAPGTSVKVTFLRNGTTFDVTLVREAVEIPSVKSEVIQNRWGYLRIIDWNPNTAERVKEVLEGFNDKGVEGLILDVRGNTGGLMTAATDTLDLFFSSGTLVSAEYRDRRFDQVTRAKPGQVVPAGMPIVLLVNGSSASASEIFTGALKDRGRATVIGQKTFGKGVIQSIFDVSDASISLTIGRYYTPNGSYIQKKGIEPDIPVEDPTLTDEQAAAYSKLLQENQVGLFLDAHPSPSARQIDSFIAGLKSQGIDPGDRLMRILVKREEERRMNVPPVVDLEYDDVLLRGIQFLETGK